MAPLAQVHLRSFLGCCRDDWGPKELRAVQRKLKAVGVEEVAELLRRVHDGTLNDCLESAGERRFTADTLELMRAFGVQLAASDSSPESSTSGDGEEVFRQAHASVGSSLRGARPLPSPHLGTRPSTREFLGSRGHMRASGFDYDAFDADLFFGDDLDCGGRLFSSVPGPKPSSRWMGSRRHEAADCDEAALRKEICRGLSHVEAVAAEAHRRNGEVTRCLAEVQSDIVRITKRMCAARQQRDRQSSYRDFSQGSTPIGSAAVYSETAPRSGKVPAMPSTPKRGSGPRSSFSAQSPSAWSGLPSASTPPRHPASESTKRRQQQTEVRGDGAGRCSGSGGTSSAGVPPRAPREAAGTRGMQSGFTFGGGASKRPARAPPLEANRRLADPVGVDDPANPAAPVQEAVRQQLLSVLDRPEADRRSFVKRLLVKWHPDRNPESIEVATSVFQYIQQEKQRLLGL